MKNSLKLMLAMGCVCLCIPRVATATCNTVASCKESIIEELEKQVSNKETESFVNDYTYEDRRAPNDDKGNRVEYRGVDLSTNTVNLSMKTIEEDYEKLLELRDSYDRAYKSCYGGTSSSDCYEQYGKKLEEANNAISELDQKAEELLYSHGEEGYIWITEDDEKLVRLQEVIDKTIEKNKLIAEQKEEIDNVIKTLGKGLGGASFSRYPTVSANVQSKVCTDSLLKAADESAKKAADVYGQMLMPTKYPTSSEDLALLDELTSKIYSNELAYTLAISTFNLNRIADETDKKIEKLGKEAVEMADSEAGAISFNSNVVAVMGSEVIPLIVNVATTTTLEAIDGVRWLPRKNVNIE